MCSCSNSVYPLNDATSGFQQVQVLQNFRFCSRAKEQLWYTCNCQWSPHVPHPGTKAGHTQQFHVYFQKVMKTKDIYPDTTLCTINSLPVPKKYLKKEKSTRIHITNPPRLCFLRRAPCPHFQSLPQDPTVSKRVGPRPASQSHLSPVPDPG